MLVEIKGGGGGGGEGFEKSSISEALDKVRWGVMEKCVAYDHPFLNDQKNFF